MSQQLLQSATRADLGHTRADRPRRPPTGSRTSPYRHRIASIAASLALLAVPCAAALAQDDPWAAQRAAMVRTIESYASSLPGIVGAKGLSRAVLGAMGKVPRHLFVPDKVRRSAYADTPLPIGRGQTISQPLMVALMTQLLEVGPDSTVLEIGTGSGYQAAVLSVLVRKVCTIEIIPALGDAASRRLKGLGYGNVHTKIGDGYLGWPACGPFDGIIVTAAAGHVPSPLVEQLKPGGRMVIPVGRRFGTQHLLLVGKTDSGRSTTRQILPVRFVPFTRAPQ